MDPSIGFNKKSCAFKSNVNQNYRYFEERKK